MIRLADEALEGPRMPDRVPRAGRDRTGILASQASASQCSPRLNYATTLRLGHSAGIRTHSGLPGSSGRSRFRRSLRRSACRLRGHAVIGRDVARASVPRGRRCAASWDILPYSIYGESIRTACAPPRVPLTC